MKLIKLKCENCGAVLEVNEDLEKIHCNFCGTEILIDDEATNLKRIEDVKLQARKNNYEQDMKEKKDKEEFEAVDKFKKGKLSKVLLVFAVLCGLITFTHNFNLTSIISFAQAILFLGSWFLGMQIIKQPNKNLYIILAVIGFGLIIPFLVFNGSDTLKEEKSTNIDLSAVELKDYVPIPNKLYGKIETDRKDLLIFKIDKIEKSEYKSYINDKVIKFGYNVDLEFDNWDNVYGAYNNEGYSIRVSYLEYNKYMSITLKAPENMTNIEWPSNGLATKVPIPKSLFGRISYNNSKQFIVDIGSTTIDDYNLYVKECENLGFTVDYSKSDKSYRAKNNEGYELHLMYLGGSKMQISVKFENDSNTSKGNSDSSISNNNTNSSITDSSINNSNEIRKDFKDAMDSYESYVDEYVEFIKKYNENPSDITLISNYAKMLTKYNQLTKDFKKWKDSDLNDAEESYFIEVETRVNKKLLEIS